MEKEKYFLVLGKANWLPKCSKFFRQYNYRIIVSSRFMNPRDFIRNLIAEETLYKKILAVVLFCHPLIFLDNRFLQFEPTVPSLLSFWIWAFWGPQISSDPKLMERKIVAHRNFKLLTEITDPHYFHWWLQVQVKVAYFYCVYCLSSFQPCNVHNSCLAFLCLGLYSGFSVSHSLLPNHLLFAKQVLKDMFAFFIFP